MIDLGSIRCNALLFHEVLDSKKNWVYVLTEAENPDFFGFMQRYQDTDKIHYKQVTTFFGQDDGYLDHWYLVYVENCFDPPLCIIRAATPTEAEEIFVENLDWARIDEVDLKDYLVGNPNKEEVDYSCGFGPNGEPYDSESVTIRELKLFQGEVW